MNVAIMLVAHQTVARPGPRRQSMARVASSVEQKFWSAQPERIIAVMRQRAVGGDCNERRNTHCVEAVGKTKSKRK